MPGTDESIPPVVACSREHDSTGAKRHLFGDIGGGSTGDLHQQTTWDSELFDGAPVSFPTGVGTVELHCGLSNHRI
jgi:hypothetical protein